MCWKDKRTTKVFWSLPFLHFQRGLQETQQIKTSKYREIIFGPLHQHLWFCLWNKPRFLSVFFFWVTMWGLKNMACSETSYSQNIYFLFKNTCYAPIGIFPPPQQLYKVLHYCCLAAKILFYKLFPACYQTRSSAKWKVSSSWMLFCNFLNLSLIN